MTQPAGPILGAAHLDDGINTRFRWNEETGLSTPATRAIGSIQSTFGGPVRVIPTAVAYPPKDLDLPGYLLQVNGLAEGYDRLDRLYNLAGTAGSVSILQMGALGLEVIPEAPVVERLKAHRVQLDYSMKGTAVPATWTALFGAYLGAAYGMVANGESMINTSAFALAAGASPAVTNAGTAPTPLVLTISVSGPRTTRFFVRCTAPGYTKRISVTPVSGGVVTITEAHGLFVPPGASVLRYEEANGTLITGTIASSIYGTRWRYEGLEETLSEVGPVILYNTRQQRAYAATSAFTASAGLTLYGPDVPRFGNSGTFDSADAGLVVEPDRTNLILQSQALGTTWTQSMVTVTNNNGTAPDGTTTGTRVQFAAGMLGTLSQSVTLTAAPYVVSFYARSTSAGTQNISVSMGAILGAQTITTGTNWARYQFLVTGTAAAYSLAFASYEPSPMIYDAADVQIWGVQVELATGQTAANATSYIPTTSTTQRRFADIVGVRPLENLLAYSNRFDKQTTSATARGLWRVVSGTVTTATLQAGPSGVTDAATLTAVGAVSGVQQRILNAEALSGKTVVFSVWVRNSVSTPDGDFLMEIEELGGSPGTSGITSGQTALDDNWRRLVVSRKLGSGVTDLVVKIRSAGTITVYFAHAHVYIASEGIYNLAAAANTASSAPYIETQAAPAYRARGWDWPEWLTQNGYIEADVCLAETANPNLGSRTILVSGSNATLTPSMHQGFVRRSSATASASNEIGAGKQNNAGTTAATYTPASSLYDGAYHKYRLEWVNYLIGGTRTIRLRLYVDGVEVSSGTTGGATAWLRPPTLEIVNPTQDSPGFQTMKNIAIGSPVLPAGAIPAPY